MNKLALSLSLLCACILGARLHADDKITLPPGFIYEDIYVGHGMISIDFDPAGRMYVCEKLGRVLMFQPKGRGQYNDPVVVLDIKDKVFTNRECGLLGIAIDPEFNTSHFFYVFFTTQSDARLVRYTIDPATNNVSGETVLLSGLPRTQEEHKSGDIHFAPKDPNSIYITVGNDTNPMEAVDNVNLYNGKVLRVNKADGKGFADNPFYDGKNLDAVSARVWATGLRNPFRFTFAASGEPEGYLYIAENGDQMDRYYQIKKGANGGWNHGRDQGLANPPDPNVHVLGTHKPSMTGIAIAEKGPFAGPNGEPVLYVEHWWLPPPGILRGVLGGKNRDTFTPIPSDPNGMFAPGCNCVNLKFGPDGALYTTNTFFGIADRNDFHLGRIKYVGTPDAAPTASPATTPEVK